MIEEESLTYMSFNGITQTGSNLMLFSYNLTTSIILVIIVADSSFVPSCL